MGRIIGHPLCGWWVCFCVIAAAGCGDDVTPSHVALAASDDLEPRHASTSLVSHASWRLVTPEEDPYWLDDDARIPCELQDLEVGDDSIEVNTRYCNHATLTQPSLRAIRVHDSVHQELWWQPLVSETAAQARLRLRIGDAELLRDDLPIPGPADVRHHHSTFAMEVPAGTPIYFHVSNHGINSYTLHLLEVEQLPAAIPTEQ